VEEQLLLWLETWILPGYQMVEDLTRLCGNLSLSVDESKEVEITNQKLTGLSTRGKSCLVVKLIVDQLIGKERRVSNEPW
jgi:hypothetical protein